MRIAITGQSGLVGTACSQLLAAEGHELVRLVRGGDGGPGTAAWHPDTGEVDATALGAIDAVLHLAGENVADGRWSAERKRRIADSRGPATEKLCRTLAALPQPPRVLVAASATGIYGDRGDELLDETSAPGEGFLADVAERWEAGTRPLADAGCRVVNLRLGVVLSQDGGALAKMLLPFRLGLGGRLGSGEQWMSWISLPDVTRVVARALADDALSGPVLAVAPNPVENRTFTKTLGRVLRRPTVLPVPAFALRLLFGEMADAMLLASRRAPPGVLRKRGFAFAHAELGPALRAVLARGPAGT